VIRVKDIYAVGTIPENIREHMAIYQKRFSLMYGLYEDKYPELHITLAKLSYNDENDVKCLIGKLGEVLKGQRMIYTEIKGICCFDPPYKSVNFHVETNPELQGLTRVIIENAQYCGIAHQSLVYPWQYHISIANPAFAKREWSDAEYKQACTLLKNEEYNQGFMMKAVELWYPSAENYKVSRFFLQD
jgi:2'-5' RNA ligase